MFSGGIEKQRRTVMALRRGLTSPVPDDMNSVKPGPDKILRSDSKQVYFFLNANPFSRNVSFLYPLKTSEYQMLLTLSTSSRPAVFKAYFLIKLQAAGIIY